MTKIKVDLMIADFLTADWRLPIFDCREILVSIVNGKTAFGNLVSCLFGNEFLVVGGREQPIEFAGILERKFHHP
jgi:hypothetical protein